MRRLVVQVIAAVVVLVFVLGIWLTGGAPKLAWLRFYSVAVVLLLLLGAIWEHWAWRWPLVQRATWVARDLRGTWRGKLTTLWKDAPTGTSPAPKTVYLVVRQTASAITVVLLSDESKSVSSFARVANDGTISALEYMYLSKPSASVEHRSRMHHGSACLDISGRPAMRLSGPYWTARKSRGELIFEQRSGTTADDYRQAQELFDAEGGSAPRAAEAE